MATCGRVLFVSLVILGVFGCDYDRNAAAPTLSDQSTPDPSDENLATQFPQEDKLQAVRMVVAWIVEDKLIDGVERYPDAEIMKTEERFFVVCDFLLADISLSSDPRVQRVDAAESKSHLEKNLYRDGTDYLDIKIVSESRTELQLSAANSFGSLGAHGFHLIFRKKNGKLTAEGRLTWVS
jgi:hypothetical protein